MDEDNDEEEYPELGALDGLLLAYRDAGFEVSHVLVADNNIPQISSSELKSVEQHN